MAPLDLVVCPRGRETDSGAQYSHDDLVGVRADLIRAANALDLRIGLGQTRTMQSGEEVRVRRCAGAAGKERR